MTKEELINVLQEKLTSHISSLIVGGETCRTIGIGHGMSAMTVNNLLNGKAPRSINALLDYLDVLGFDATITVNVKRGE